MGFGPISFFSMFFMGWVQVPMTLGKSVMYLTLFFWLLEAVCWREIMGRGPDGKPANPQ